MPCLFSRSQLRYLLSSPTAITFLCYDDGVPVGYGIALRSKLRNGLYKGRIYYLGVIPEYRYKGAGSMLLGAMEEYLIKTGVSFIVLETAKGNNGAETFFSKHGYMEAAFLPQYYPAGDGVRLKKIITTG